MEGEEGERGAERIGRGERKRQFSLRIWPLVSLLHPVKDYTPRILGQHTLLLKEKKRH